MHPSQRDRLQQQKRISSYANNCDSYEFFNLLTGPEFLNQVETLLPEHRERLFPPTETLSMFLSQAMSADRSKGATGSGLAFGQRGQVLPFAFHQVTGLKGSGQRGQVLPFAFHQVTGLKGSVITKGVADN